MAYQLSVAVRNAMLDQLEVATGTSPVLQLRTGAPPANCAAADSGTLLASIALPSDWMSAASAGSKELIGTPSGNASATGTVGHYRLKDTALASTHHQGTVTATGGGGDMTLDNVSLAITQLFTLTGFNLTQGNA